MAAHDVCEVLEGVNPHEVADTHDECGMAVPQWIKDLAQAIININGDGKHEITIEMVSAKELGETDGGGRVMGDAIIRQRYLSTHIRLREDLREADDVDTVIHEFIHVLQGPQRQAVDRIIDLVPSTLEEHSYNLWLDGNEAATVILTRILKPFIVEEWEKVRRERKQEEAAEAAREELRKSIWLDEFKKVSVSPDFRLDIQDSTTPALLEIDAKLAELEERAKFTDPNRCPSCASRCDNCPVFGDGKKPLVETLADIAA